MRPTECTAPGCHRKAAALGLCTMHYKRAWRGKPLTTPQVGDPSGFGRWGQMDRGEEDVLCHECGNRFASVGAHSVAVHGMSARQYRVAHGIPSTMPLVCLRLSRERSQQASSLVGSEGWKHMEAHRDPAAAAAARDESSFRRIGLAEESRRNGAKAKAKARAHPCRWCGRPVLGRRQTCSAACQSELRSWLTAEQRARQGEAAPGLSVTDVDDLRSGVDQEQVVRGLQGRGVRSQDIAAVLGVSAAWMSEHYPR